MKRAIFLLLLLAACTNVPFEEHTTAGSKYVLANNMTVLLKENHDTGMIAIDLFIKRSIAADGALPGLGHFTNRMLLAGTTTRTREKINKEIEDVGGTILARTYAESSEIIIEVPSDHFTTALEILHDVLTHPAFAPEEIERERTTILDELSSKYDNANVMAEELFMKNMYFGHPYANPKDGYPETVKKITRDDIVNHYNTWYTSNDMILSIVGNINEKPTIAAINQLFSDMKPKPLPPETLPVSAHTKPLFETKHMPLESYYIHTGYLTVPANNTDFIKIRLTHGILGSGSGSRLFYELRDKRALAYSVYSMTPSVRTNGFFKVIMMSRPNVLNQSLAGINEQLQRIKKEPVSPEELATVKQKLKGFFFLDHQKTPDQANYLGLYEMDGLGYQYDKNYPLLIDTVTPEDINYAANTYFTIPVTAIVGPFEEGTIS